jgi:hypothetical protein
LVEPTASADGCRDAVSQSSRLSVRTPLVSYPIAHMAKSEGSRMRDQIAVLREVFEEWLRIHELDYDFRFYTRDEWLARGEQVVKGAELVLAFDNELVSMMNFTGAYEIEEELQELAGGFGYYFEFGNHWNIGFYLLDDWPPLPPANASYFDLLKDPRWAAKRNRIVRRASEHCEDCGNRTNRVEVHHCYYRYGRYPWQYPDAALLAVCQDCHKRRAKIELEWRAFMPRLTTRELRTLKDTLDKCLYWFDRRRLFSFLATLSKHDVKQLDRLAWLMETRGHPDERDV